ncbi:heavy metal translocating P-type ATPase [Vagococcus vulneris]|uniref:Heavy metal translocating P-type ATPase n=1 Tax=Vagococcus vulneris TaxID=1977869 RepID=A0A429ZX73_9ENTE|nr:heavy metal translocating P-type ATPase [Vagococcus vulneris]RST98429.1 heavy metal translocating P-type ATPase [Vagococcus vulneris]
MSHANTQSAAKSCDANHNHEHNHGNLPTILYVVGLVLFIVALFPISPAISSIMFVGTVILSGYHIIIEGFEDTYKETKTNRKFTPNVHVLMALAAIGASIIGDYREAALLILIFAGAHFLEHYVENKSKREITNLMKLNPTEARLIQPDGKTKIVDVNSLNVGDSLQVLNGDQIPTDGIISSGATSIDESSINGESIPVDKTIGDTVFGSTINGNSTFTMTVTKESSDTVFAKILALVNQSQNNLSKTATRIKRFEPRYVTAILIIIPIYIILTPFILNYSWYESFYKGMVFLTVASPCALAASDIPATLSAISNLAKRGVLFKGGSYLSNMATLQAIAFDKTGTLTEGKPKVTDVFYLDNTEDKQELMTNIITAMEKQANHPLADAIVAHLQPTEDLIIEIDNQIGHGIVAEYLGNSYRIGKPSLFTNVAAELKIETDRHTEAGKTVVYIAENDNVIGLIAMMDLPNEQAKKVINYLKSQHIHTAMITGDAAKTGQAVANTLGIDDVFGNVLPENKSSIVDELKEKYGETAMVGDGINDAPALVNADIGIAMGDGTDVAIDVADVVLMQNDLTKIQYAHQLSKQLDKIVMQNIVFSMLVVLTLVLFNIFGAMSLPIGVLVHEGSTLVVLFNGVRLLKPLHLK